MCLPRKQQWSHNECTFYSVGPKRERAMRMKNEGVKKCQFSRTKEDSAWKFRSERWKSSTSTSSLLSFEEVEEEANAKTDIFSDSEKCVTHCQQWIFKIETKRWCEVKTYTWPFFMQKNWMCFCRGLWQWNSKLSQMTLKVSHLWSWDQLEEIQLFRT